MAGEYIDTLGDPAQLARMIKGEFFLGHREPRVALVGRSNVGKSSLVNALMGGKLAQVSDQPGKTRKIHFYLWKEAGKIIADLPGYGFAKASRDEQNQWARFIQAYLRGDPGIDRAMVLLDSRHGPTPLDEEAIRFLASESIPLSFVFTKSDTLRTQSDRARRQKEVKAAFEKLGYDSSESLWISSRTKDGIKPLADWLKERGEGV